MLDLLATGYPSIDYIMPVSHSPAVGETALVHQIMDMSDATFGGCGANVVMALAYLGFRTGLATILGNDDLGQTYMAHMVQCQIDTQNIIVMDEEKTSRSLLFRNPEGEYQNFFYPGAAGVWDDTLYLKGLDTTQYALVTVGPYTYNLQFVDQVSRAQIPLIWQLKPDINAYPPESIRRFLDASAVIMMNHIEANLLLSLLNKSHIHDLWRNTIQVIIVTQGKSGAIIYTPDSETQVPSVAKMIKDTTGAGDGFTAGFIAGMFKGNSWEDCAKLGSTLASFVIEKVGCQTNLPNWQQLQSRYKENFGDR